eukprot:3418977-Prymnesium_polylepis.2
MPRTCDAKWCPANAGSTWYRPLARTDLHTEFTGPWIRGPNGCGGMAGAGPSAADRQCSEGLLTRGERQRTPLRVDAPWPARVH